MSAIKRGVGRSGSGSRMNPRQTDTRSSNRNPRSDYGEPSLSSRTPYRKRPDDSYDNSKSFRPKNDRERDGRATAPYSNNRFTARPKYNDQQGDGRVKAPFSDSRVAARPRYNDEENSRSSSKPFRPNNRQEGRDQFKAPFSENRFAARPRYNDQGDSQQDIRQPRSFPPSPFSPARIRTSRSETEDNLQPRSFQKSSTFLPARIRSSQSESEFQSSPYRSVRDTSTSRNSFDRGQQLRIGVPGEENSERQSVGYSANGNRFDRANDNYEGKDAREEVSFKTRDSRESFKIPLTTAASEFIYGRSSVLAALKAASRRLYRLYLVGSSGDDKNSFEELYKCALNNDVKIVWLNRPDELAALDRVVKGRPHNGILLEASPLPKLPISALGEVEKGVSFQVELRHQSQEEEVINGNISQIPFESTVSRYPLVILLDEIVDQGNLGGILRSAYFLGADAVVLSSHMAAMNAVTLKAASGAAEGIRLFSLHNTTGFLATSKQNGWKVFASVAPPAGKSINESKHLEADNLGSPLQHGPCILLMGGEGEGLRRDLIMKADHTISITGQRSRQSGVDSLNVSVAAGILMDAFLKQTVAPVRKAQESDSAGTSDSSNLLF